MKQGGFLLLALVVFFLYSDTAANVSDLETYCKFYNGHTTCSLKYSPHCASDGLAYFNKCQFCNQYVKDKRRGRTLRLIKLAPC